MEAIVLNSNFEAVGLIDSFESFIWTDRYISYGDFEIVSTPISNFITNALEGKYLLFDGSDHVMVIEELNIRTNVTEGNRAIIRGRSLESILYQRIVWNQTVISGNFQDAIEKLLLENAINSADSDRNFSRLYFVPSEDENIINLVVEDQFYGEYIYDAIASLCQSKNVGFRLTLDEDNRFRFELYYGVDRSEDQFLNPHVVFSPNFENVINSDYLQTNKFLKTVTLVAGEKGIGNGRITKIVSLPDGPGEDMDRREMFTDASNITRSTPDQELTDEEYLDQLNQKGLTDLFFNSNLQTFEGQVDTTNSYKYAQDFYMGDIVQVENEYGQKGKTQIIEMIFSQDGSGIKTYPSFKAI